MPLADMRNEEESEVVGMQQPRQKHANNSVKRENLEEEEMRTAARRIGVWEACKKVKGPSYLEGHLELWLNFIAFIPRP